MITTTRNRAGGYTITALSGGYYVTRQYYGYTKKEAERMFRDYLKGTK